MQVLQESLQRNNMNVFSRVRCTASSLTSVSRRINCKHLATVSSDQDRAVDNCTSLIKLHDFDSYLSGILLPKKFRGPYFAVRAFHVELALIKDQCRKNVLSGRMRFQYWRETIDQVFSVTELTAQQSAAQPPIARALRSYVNEFNLPQRYFERAIDAR